MDSCGNTLVGPRGLETSNQTVMSGETRIAGVDFPRDLTRSIVFVCLLRLVAIVSGAKLVR
jgi:hypothetical protein